MKLTATFIGVTIVLGAVWTGVMAMTRNPPNPVYERNVHAPEFLEGTDWINVERPLTMQELRGRVVLLDFWTYCCINCMHVLPDLARLEDKYGDRLVIVGVHSAKFEGEQDTENIRDAVKRYNIRHPVINDAGFELWNRYGVNAWPTLVLIDHDGYIVGRVSGEGNYDVLDRFIGAVLDEGAVSVAGLDPLPVMHEAAASHTAELLYPGKVLYDERSETLFIADSGHHRILATDPGTGDILYIIGSGRAAIRDGTFGEASFFNPQGMSIVGRTLYVADTDNHALRAVDLDDRLVYTISGDGIQGAWGSAGGGTSSARLNSPWDLVHHKGKLYIAMAGSHQLWVYDPEAETVRPFAGSGRENIIDGSLKNAALAQPSGITTDGTDLYFADSETSSIRAVGMNGKLVYTLVGTGLFDFGFHDGAFESARLQHPLGVSWGGGSLWIADTYNNRIRRIDPAKQTITTIAGADEDTLVDGVGRDARFDEPGGLAYHDGRLFVADTNNHAVRILDVATGEVRTLDVIPAVRVAASGDMLVTILPPDGYHITMEAPSDVRAMGTGARDGRTIQLTGVQIDENSLQAKFRPADGRTVLEFTGTLYVCRDGGGTCHMRPFTFKRVIRPGERHGGANSVEYRVVPPES